MTIKPFQAQFSLALLSTAAAAVVAYLAVEAFKKLYMRGRRDSGNFRQIRYNRLNIGL
jgi:hypothetical protein